jgi:hypothetical protein
VFRDVRDGALHDNVIGGGAVQVGKVANPVGESMVEASIISLPFMG